MSKPEAAHIKVWECVGCGRIEAPQPCLGVCQDRAVEFVHGADYDALAKRYAQLVEHSARMRELLVRLACTHPREGRWEAGYRALQARAAQLMDGLQAPGQDEVANDS